MTPLGMKTLGQTGKGWRTVAVNILTIGGALLAGPTLAEYIAPQYVVAGVAAINIVLRWLTTTSVGESE